MGRNLILTGQKVALSDMTEADQPMFCEWLQNPELRTLIDDLRVPGLEDQMKWFKRVQQPDRRFFSLLIVPDEILIGNAGFVEIDPAKKEATLRITIGNPDFLGKGLGSEAVALLVRYAREKAGWKKLLLNVLPSNTRAIRAYEKSGFTKYAEKMQDGKSIIIMTLDL